MQCVGRTKKNKKKNRNNNKNDDDDDDNNNNKHWCTQGGGGLQTGSPPKAKFKITDFVDTVVSKILRDLSFSLNQPPKSTDD